MELIAATRVAKAQTRANEARPYAARITTVIEDLAKGGASASHPLLEAPEAIRKVAYVVIAGDRGLAGPYNSTVIRAAERELMARSAEGIDYSLTLIGKKARDYFTFRNYTVDAFYEGITDTPDYNSAREVAEYVSDQFIDGDIDQVILIFTEFVSIGTQKLAVRQFLPLESVQTIADVGGGAGELTAEFEFEPSADGVLESLLPRYVESRLFSALLDSSASEHANRQRAMKAATDNAEELITKLGRQLSSARQAAITTEIMEIVGGAEALGSEREEPGELITHHLHPEHVAAAHIGGDHWNHPGAAH